MTKNEMITMSYVESDVKPTDEFKRILKTLPQVVDKAQKLLATPANEDIDENNFKETQKELEEYNRFYKNIEAAKKEIRKLYDNEKKQMIQNIDEALQNARYDELADCVNEIKNRKKMIENNRKQKRWDKLQEHYNTLLEQTYPDVKEKLPNLDFNHFQATHDKLVSGAKSFKINDKVLNTLSDYLDQSHKDLQAILNMNSLYEEKLLKDYETTGDLSDVFIKEKRYKEEDERIQKRRAEQIKAEKERIEKENKKKEQVAKLTNQKVEKQSTKNIEKLGEIYEIVTTAATKYSNKITDKEAENILTKITEVINKNA